MFSETCVWLGKGSIAAKFDCISEQSLLNWARLETDFKDRASKAPANNSLCSIHWLCDSQTEIAWAAYETYEILDLSEVSGWSPWFHLGDLISATSKYESSKTTHLKIKNKRKVVYLTLTLSLVHVYTVSILFVWSPTPTILFSLVKLLLVVF